MRGVRPLDLVLSIFGTSVTVIPYMEFSMLGFHIWSQWRAPSVPGSRLPN